MLPSRNSSRLQDTHITRAPTHNAPPRVRPRFAASHVATMDERPPSLRASVGSPLISWPRPRASSCSSQKTAAPTMGTAPSRHSRASTSASNRSAAACCSIRRPRPPHGPAARPGEVTVGWVMVVGVAVGADKLRAFRAVARPPRSNSELCPVMFRRQVLGSA
eukprot:938701-Prymnesium_polylepis.1